MKQVVSKNILKKSINIFYYRNRRFSCKYFKKTSLCTLSSQERLIKAPSSLDVINVQSIRFNSSEESEAQEKPIIIYEKFQSRLQEEMILDLLDSKEIPNHEKWTDIRNNILSNKGGRINERNIDGTILHKITPNLSMTKSFIQYLNKKNKKLSLLQLSHLFESFYQNKTMCSPGDRESMKKMFKQICDNDNAVTFDIPTVYGLVAGISLTDSWKDGLVLIRKLNQPEREVKIYIPLIEAAIENDDIPFAIKYLKQRLCVLSNKAMIPEHISELWLSKITTKQKLDEFLYFLQDNALSITNSIANTIERQCKQHNLYQCTHTSISNTRECRHCYHKLNECKISEEDFEELKNNFVRSAIVGKDIFFKSTPEEFNDFLKFVKTNAPFDIVMDALNVALYKGQHSNRVETLKLVVDHYLKQNKRILVLGREHMLKWPQSAMNYIRNNCCFFLVKNVSQDDPYILYATMYSGVNAQFISRDLMRSHLFLLPNEKSKSIFRKWLQLNQIVILSIHQRRLKIKHIKQYEMTAQPGFRITRNSDPSYWHIPYQLENVEQTFQNVYEPKSTWLCLQSDKTSWKHR